jgi:hypothetical protein
MDNVTPEIAPTYLQLRSRILSLNPAEMDLTPSNTGLHVWGVLMETGYTVGTATLVALADGTTSLYYSTGGGLLGSGEYIPVAEASKALVTQAENHLQQASYKDKFPLPEVGQVRFIFLTYSGAFTAEASEKTLISGNHPLSQLYTLGHETLTQLRLLAENKRK